MVKMRQSRSFVGRILTVPYLYWSSTRRSRQSKVAERRLCMRPFSEALTPMFALAAIARLLFPWGALIVGVFVGTSVLALGIFIIVTAASIGLL